MNFEEKMLFELDFPIAAVRQKKALDKLARCHTCYRLCCCMKHLLEHESHHLTQDKENAVTPEKSNVSTDLSGWVDATTSNIDTYTSKIKYPMLCVYCKIYIKDNQKLRYFVKRGPPCLSKDSHWLVSNKKYREVSGLCDLVNVTTNEYLTARPFVDNLEKKLLNNSNKKERSTPHSYWPSFPTNINKMETSGFNFTSDEEVAVFPQVAKKNIFHSVERMCPISTSTPQEECASSGVDNCTSTPCTALTPITKQDVDVPRSILCTAKNYNQSKENTVRKVTFSMDHEIEESKYTAEEIISEAAEQNHTSNNMANMTEKTSANIWNSSVEKLNFTNEKPCGGILNTKQSNDQDGSTRKTNCYMEDQFRAKNRIEIMNMREHRKPNLQNKSSELDEKCEGELHNSKEIGSLETETKLKSKTNTHVVEQIRNVGEEKMQNASEEIDFYSGGENVKLADSKMMVKLQRLENNKGSSSKDDRSLEEDSFELEFYSVDNTDMDSIQLKDSDVNIIKSWNLKESLMSSTEESPCITLPKVYYDSKTESVFSEISTKENRLTIEVNIPQSSGIGENSINTPDNKLLCDKNIKKEYDGICSSSQSNEKIKGQGMSLQSFSSQEQIFSPNELTISKRRPNDEEQEEGWSFTRITSALSSSWSKAKCLVISSLTRKRSSSDNSEADDDASLAKRVKLCTISPYSSNNRRSRAYLAYDYNIKSRRPLPRMEKQ